MKCQKCGVGPAITHITIVTGMVFSELHFCARCSESMPNASPVITAALQCDRCGSGLRDIQARGRLGCAKDYEIFAPEIADCVEKWHGSTQHKGKIPGGIHVQR